MVHLWKELMLIHRISNCALQLLDVCIEIETSLSLEVTLCPASEGFLPHRGWEIVHPDAFKVSNASLIARNTYLSILAKPESPLAYICYLTRIVFHTSISWVAKEVWLSWFIHNPIYTMHMRSLSLFASSSASSLGDWGDATPPPPPHGHACIYRLCVLRLWNQFTYSSSQQLSGTVTNSIKLRSSLLDSALLHHCRQTQMHEGGKLTIHDRTEITT